MQNFHYFGSTAFNWAVAPTREEVIRKLASAAGASLIKANVKSQGGLYCWTCKVHAPQEAHYDIESYAPKGVTWDDTRENRIVNTKGAIQP